jgi:hypothetical protein
MPYPSAIPLSHPGSILGRISFRITCRRSQQCDDNTERVFNRWFPAKFTDIAETFKCVHKITWQNILCTLYTKSQGMYFGRDRGHETYVTIYLACFNESVPEFILKNLSCWLLLETHEKLQTNFMGQLFFLKSVGRYGAGPEISHFYRTWSSIYSLYYNFILHCDEEIPCFVCLYLYTKLLIHSTKVLVFHFMEFIRMSEIISRHIRKNVKGWHHAVVTGTHIIRALCGTTALN